MSVAWIGNRDAQVPHAVEHAATLLVKSRCPVITIEADTDATRAAISLARKTGATYDHSSGGLAQEIALFTGHGGVFLSPSEALRRADVVLVVGDLPEAASQLLKQLSDVAPDLAGDKARTFFSLMVGDLPAAVAKQAVPLTLESASLAGAVAALRSMQAGRRTAASVTGFNQFSAALAEARFVAVLCSGQGCDALVLEMLQGLVDNINKTIRASMLLWPASENGWGSALTSTWKAGFPLPTSFGKGEAAHDPWRWSASRMIEEGEADLWLRVGAHPAATREDVDIIALTHTTEPVEGAAVTIAIGRPGVDHDAVLFSGLAGTFIARPAEAPGDLPSAAAILRAIAEHLPEHEVAPC